MFSKILQSIHLLTSSSYSPPSENTKDRLTTYVAIAAIVGLSGLALYKFSQKRGSDSDPSLSSNAFQKISRNPFPQEDTDKDDFTKQKIPRNLKVVFENHYYDVRTLIVLKLEERILKSEKTPPNLPLNEYPLNNSISVSKTKFDEKMRIACQQFSSSLMSQKPGFDERYTEITEMSNRAKQEHLKEFKSICKLSGSTHYFVDDELFNVYQNILKTRKTSPNSQEPLIHNSSFDDIFNSIMQNRNS